MPNDPALPTLPCPNCRQPMQTRDLEQNYHGEVRVELCFACAGIWFDHLGSVQLAPAAVIELFKEIHSHLNDARQPVANRLPCPRCGEALALGYDLSKAGKFSYYRCPRGDGRYTPFFQFLREKQFVRDLTTAEVQRVRSQVRQIRCSECGAPIDLEQSSQCKYCHAPVSFLDPEAVERAARMWSSADNRRHLGPNPEALANALMAIQLPHMNQPSASGVRALANLLDGPLPDGYGAHGTGAGAELTLDLVALGVRAIGRLFTAER